MSEPDIEIDGNGNGTDAMKDPNKPEQERKLLLSETALILEAGTVVAIFLFLLSWYLLFLVVTYIMLWVWGLYILAAPIIGVLLGIVSLCTSPRTKRNVICSSLAIAVPIITVITLILLFSANVIVIRFM